jgi:hypothetical protein
MGEGPAYIASSQPADKTLKGSRARDFRIHVFFLNQFPPGNLSAYSGHIEFLRKFVEIFERKGKAPVSMTPAPNEKFFRQKVFSYLVEMLLGCCLQS